MTADVAARTSALVIPRVDLATLTVTGPDRVKWLQGILTCDVAGLVEGDGRYGLVLSRQGKILSDVLVVAARDVVHLGVPASQRARVLEWLVSFLVMEDADIAPSPGLVWFGAFGPDGRTAGARLAEAVGGAVGAVDPTGLGGAHVVVPAENAARASEIAASIPGVVLGTETDFERLRVERAVPRFGADMDEQRNPHEAALDRRAVSWDKGCYLGQEAVCMLDMRGKVKRRLVLLDLPGAAGPPEPATKVSDMNGVAVGEIRSGVLSDVRGGPIALAIVAEAFTPAGTELLLDGGTRAIVGVPNR